MTAEMAAEFRAIRVFISSTFRDMQAERDELVKHTFPALRRLCEARGVAWSEVDLRWGILEEQRSEGSVLPICLEEIDRCRPHFIAVLGERYGWVPEDVPAGLIEREPWLARHPESSVTEFEIRHGILNDPEACARGFVYLRSPEVSAGVSPEDRSNFEEGALPDEVVRFGENGALERTRRRREKLANLKESLRRGATNVREGFRDPRELGEWVLADFTALIDRLYPEDSTPDPRDQEAALHEAYAASHREIYVARVADLTALDDHVHGVGPPLVLLGDAGSGKSALLANWAKHHAGSHPDAVVISHFVGATDRSADWVHLLRRVLAELGRRLDLRLPVPDGGPELRQTFARALSMVAARGGAVLVIDALNQLEDRDQARDLLWLPARIPPEVRVVLSTLPGRSLDALRERGWPEFRLALLESGDRRALIERYLYEKYRRRLSGPQLDRIAAAPSAANPLFLRTLLEELRVFGVHERLDARIDHYLDAATVSELFQRVLARLEQDYERDRPGLVRDAATALWAGRRGLAEAELLSLLGTPDVPLPQAIWSPLHLALWESLHQTSGRVAFSHEALREAVAQRYLTTDAERTVAHRRLAEAFQEAPAGPRRADELPWQLARAGEWDRLVALLSDLPFLESLRHSGDEDIRRYWVQIEAASDYRVQNVYRDCFARADVSDRQIEILLSLHERLSRWDDLLSAREALRGRWGAAGDLDRLVVNLCATASILVRRGRAEEALALLSLVPKTLDRIEHPWVIQDYWGVLGMALWEVGRLDEALDVLGSKEAVCRRANARKELSEALLVQSFIRQLKGEYEKAARLIAEVERLAREDGDLDALQAVLGEKGLLLLQRRCFEQALELFRRQEQLCRQLGDKVSLAGNLGNQGSAQALLGRDDEALRLHGEAEALSKEVGLEIQWHFERACRASLLYLRGEPEQAREMIDQAVEFFRSHSVCERLVTALWIQGHIRSYLLDPVAACSSYDEAAQNMWTTHSPGEIAEDLYKAGRHFLAVGETGGAMPRYGIDSPKALQLYLTGTQTLVEYSRYARDYLRRASECEGATASIHVAYGAALDRMDMVDEAIAAYSRAQALSPDDFNAAVRLAELVIRRETRR